MRAGFTPHRARGEAEPMLSLRTRSLPDGFTLSLAKHSIDCLDFTRRLVEKMTADGETVLRAAVSIDLWTAWDWFPPLGRR